MSYLEKGQFKDIGLDKLCMLLQALGCSADELLQEAGYLAAQPDGLPEPSSYLRQVFGMSAEQARLAIPYLEFIAKRSH